MGMNIAKAFYNPNGEAIVEYHHSRSDYVARVRMSLAGGLDGGMSIIDLNTEDQGVSYIPFSILTQVYQTMLKGTPDWHPDDQYEWA